LEEWQGKRMLRGWKKAWGVAAPSPARTFSRPDLAIPCQVASPQSPTPFHQATRLQPNPTRPSTLNPQPSTFNPRLRTCQTIDHSEPNCRRRRVSSTPNWVTLRRARCGSTHTVFELSDRERQRPLSFRGSARGFRVPQPSNSCDLIGDSPLAGLSCTHLTMEP